MSGARIGLIAATAIGSALTYTVNTAEAGCCGWGGWGGGCCNAQTYVQPAPVTYYVQPQPTVVQVQPAPIVVQVAQPQVIVQQASSYASVPSYVVNQGPVYSGPGADYGPAVYQPARPIGAYPYVPGWSRPAYRPWRYGYSYHRPYQPRQRYYYGARR